MLDRRTWIGSLVTALLAPFLLWVEKPEEKTRKFYCTLELDDDIRVQNWEHTIELTAEQTNCKQLIFISTEVGEWEVISIGEPD